MIMILLTKRFLKIRLSNSYIFEEKFDQKYVTDDVADDVDDDDDDDVTCCEY